MSREQKMKKTVIITVAIALLAIVRCSEQGSEPAGVTVKTCGICHALPPNDPGHAAHWYSLTDRHFSCGACHKGYEADSASGSFRVDSLTHMNGVVDVVFSAPWNDSGKAVYDPGLKQCSNVYCHGAIHQGTNATPLWGFGMVSITQCDACHNLTSIYAGHHVHARLPVYQGIGPSKKLILGGSVDKCDNCHAGFSIANKTVNAAIHIDGVVTEPTCGGTGCHDVSEWTTWSGYLQKNPTPPLSKMLLKALSSDK
jgi:predicted CxxxxCH...CXXCH cytochrome family protein